MLNTLFSELEKDKSIIKIVFISSIIIFIFSYLHSLTHEIAFHDNAWLESMGATFSLGRFSAAIIYYIFKIFLGERYITTPVLNGIMCYIFLFFITYIIIKMLNIKNTISIILISMLMIANPFVSSTLAVRYDSIIKPMGIFIGVLAVYIYSKNQKYILLSALLISFSIGVYQAFIAFFVSLALLYIIRISIENDYNLVDYIKCIFKYIILFIISVCIYFILLKISLNISGYELDTYKNANNIIESSLFPYIERIIYTYKYYFLVKDSAYYFVLNTDKLYYLIFAISLVLIIINYKKIKISSGAIISVLLFPVAVNLNVILFGIKNYHYSLMGCSIVFQYIILIYFIDSYYDNIYIMKKSLILVILYVLVIFQNVYACNLLSLKAEFVQSQAKSYFNNLIIRIESTENYNPNMNICFVNEFKKNIETYNSSFEEFKNVHDYNYIYGMDLEEVINNYAWRRFMWLWNGYKPNVLPDDEYKDKEEIKNMTSYPENGSIKIIDNVVVVKFADYE